MRRTTQFSIIAIVLFFALVHPPAMSYWVWSPEAGKFVNPETEIQGTPQELYDEAMELYKQKNLKEATGILRFLLKKHPGSQIAPEAQYRLGVINEERGDYLRAFHAYRDLLQRYPQTDRMNETLGREFRIGNLFLSGRKAKLMGFEILPSGPRAVEIFKHIVDAAPYSEYGDKAQFHLGLAYKKTNHFEEAIQAFQALLDQYPSSKLAAQAQFQIADTSYLQTVAATRDQRVMDRASKEIDRFLKSYPDSSVSDKAAKLRQEIDEKNAEKNYRIGLFYEKENFLDSAFIYYRDVAERYAHTLWGTNAKERLQALEKPAEYLKAQEKEVAIKKAKLQGEIQSVPSSESARRKEIEWELKRVEKEEKELQKSKPATLKRRLAGLHQKERELKEKEKALAKKKKRFKENFSEDLANAFKSWEASLEKEKAELVRERLRIKDWEKSLGVDTTPFYTELVPFGKEPPTPVEQIQRLEAKKIEELGRKKKELFEKKERLYQGYEKFLRLQGLSKEDDAAYRKEREKIEGWEEEIKNLEKALEEKNHLYEKHFGGPAWQAVWNVPKNVVERSVGVINPFEGEPKKDWSSKSPEELKKLHTEWQGRVANQKKLVDSIGRAFDDELSRSEQKRLGQQVQERETDSATLRRAIKQMEREIRSRYNEIQDRNDRKNELLEQLEKELKGKESSQGKLGEGTKKITAPIRGSLWLGKSFLFGLPERDVELTEEAKRASSKGRDSESIQAIRKEIELESILIEARNREIEGLTRELDTLRARASLSGVRPVRSLLVKFPYVFVREAIASANRLVPKRDQKERLISQLNEETAKLEQFKKELVEIEGLMKKKKAQMVPSAATAETKPEAAETIPNQVALQSEIRSLQKELDIKKETFRYEHDRFEKVRWRKLSEGRAKAERKKLVAIEKDIIRLIEEEQKTETEESFLLAKKKQMVEELLAKLPSDFFSRELRVEQKEIESRLSEIQKRQSSLGEESKRFLLKPIRTPK